MNKIKMRSQSVQPKKTSNFINLPKIIKYQAYEQQYDESQHRIRCTCNLCIMGCFDQIKTTKTPIINYLQCKQKMKFFLDCISRTKKSIGFSLQIPHICFYFEGTPQKLYANKQGTIQGLQVIGNSSTQIFKIMTKNCHQTIQKQNLKSIEKIFNRNLNLFAQIPVIHQKYIESIIPKYLQSCPLTKGIRYLSVHNQKGFLSTEVSRGEKLQNISTVYFFDGYCCVVNQIQLRELLFTQNLNTSKIIMISSYIQPKTQNSIYFTSYSSKCLKTKQSYLFCLACRQLQAQMGILSKLDDDYPNQQEIYKIQKQSLVHPQQYVNYQMYKIVKYLVGKVNIFTQELILGWTQGIDNLFYLSFVYKFKYHDISIPKIQKSDQKLIDRQLQKTLLVSWEINKQSKSLQFRRRKFDVMKQSRDVFHNLYPQGDFDRLVRNRKSSILRREKNKSFRYQKLKLETIQTRIKQDKLTPLTKRTWGKSSIYMQSSSRQASISVPPSKRLF